MVFTPETCLPSFSLPQVEGSYQTQKKSFRWFHVSLVVPEEQHPDSSRYWESQSTQESGRWEDLKEQRERKGIWWGDGKGKEGCRWNLPPHFFRSLYMSCQASIPSGIMCLIIKKKALIQKKKTKNLPNMLKHDRVIRKGHIPSTPQFCVLRDFGLWLWTSHFLRWKKKISAKKGLLKSLTPLSPNLFPH